MVMELRVLPYFCPGLPCIITGANGDLQNLQPGVYSSNPNLCISNSANVGKTFSLEVSDTNGNLISKSDVIISTVTV